MGEPDHVEKKREDHSTPSGLPQGIAERPLWPAHCISSHDLGIGKRRSAASRPLLGGRRKVAISRDARVWSCRGDLTLCPRGRRVGETFGTLRLFGRNHFGDHLRRHGRLTLLLAAYASVRNLFL